MQPKIKFTSRNWAVIAGDTHLGKWVEEHGDISHGMDYEARFRELCREGDTVIDGGANIGDTAIPLAKVVGPTGRVLAFEPNPAAFGALVVNTRGYSQIECYPFALGRLNSTLFTMDLSPNVGASHITASDEADEDLQFGKRQPIFSTNLNQLFKMRLFDKISFIKLDLEGFELAALRGAWDVIQIYHPSLMVETAAHCLRFGSDRMDLYDRLREWGYSVSPDFQTLDAWPQYDVIARHPDFRA